MTPKEKAEELIKKMSFAAPIYYEESKQCALIAIDEIIEALKITTGHCELRKIDANEVQKDFQYWQEVKQEIERI